VTRRDWILLGIVAVLVALPLVLVGRSTGGTSAPGASAAGANAAGHFAGSDAQGQALANSIDPGYKPWFKPFWTPPSTEVESGIFALQAGLGCGFLGYYLGLRVGRKRSAEERDEA
jgi:cobalt/nickel transport protein